MYSKLPLDFLSNLPANCTMSLYSFLACDMVGEIAILTLLLSDSEAYTNRYSSEILLPHWRGDFIMNHLPVGYFK